MGRNAGIKDFSFCRRPSPRLGSPRVCLPIEQGIYGVDRAMSYQLPPWIRPPLEDLEPPTTSSCLEPSSSLGAGAEDETFLGYEHRSADESIDETHIQQGIAIAGKIHNYILPKAKKTGTTDKFAILNFAHLCTIISA